MMTSSILRCDCKRSEASLDPSASLKLEVAPEDQIYQILQQSQPQLEDASKSSESLQEKSSEEGQKDSSVHEQKRGRTRAVSLTYDWDNVVTSRFQKRKIKKISRSKEYLSDDYYWNHPGFIQFERSACYFRTGSVYTGQWNGIGMHGQGLFKLPHNVEYEGSLRDGMFHGEGTLTYPMGQKIDGEWVKGKLMSFKYRFSNGLEYYEPWKYCQMPDRRYFECIQTGLRPAGRSLLTSTDPPREIPEGCYDTGDGFYNPKTKCVWSAIKPNKIIRVPKPAEERWIMENCRKAWDEPTRHRPDLFEHWVSGRSEDSVFREGAKDAAQGHQLSESDSSLGSYETVNINMIISPTYEVASSYASWFNPVPTDTSLKGA